MRTKRFSIDIEVSNQFLKTDEKQAEALVWTAIHDRAAGDLTGPRGGRYVPILGTLSGTIAGDTSDGWTRNVRTYHATVMARYVRPAAASAAISEPSEARSTHE